MGFFKMNTILEVQIFFFQKKEKEESYNERGEKRVIEKEEGSEL